MTINCKICNNQNYKFIGKPVINKNFPNGEKNNYQILQCSKCKFYFISPEIDLTQGQWQQLYERDYFAGANVTNWHKKLRDQERKFRLEYISSKLTIPKDKFLDMGCGEGFVLREAREYGFNPYGLDIAKNLSSENADNNFFIGNIFEAKYPDDYFSVIYMDSVLEHILTPIETLKELKRILKPGGVLFLIVPNEDSLMNSYIKTLYTLTFQSNKYGKIKPFVSPYHVQGFNPISLRTALKNVQFNSIEIKGFGGTYAMWKAHKFGTKPYIQELLIYPIGLLSVVLNKQIQLMACAVK
jgi:2-polyprenyl-3-methyl-5-hydroxy-6-metoxy-1,4-benzoquinol methylase